MKGGYMPYEENAYVYSTNENSIISFPTPQIVAHAAVLIAGYVFIYQTQPVIVRKP
jgi:hypothetical protein